ncbi:MAG: PH domain-containing protein [candidate division SR1 bacterium]|nr:PH domain-containing protein [candidate division SR1 bacterium]
MDNIVRETPIQLIFRIVWISIIFNIIYATLSILGDSSSIFGNGSAVGSITYDTFFLLLFIIIQLLIITYLIISRYSVYYKIEEDYILHKTGILTKREERFKLNGIRAIHIHKKFRGNLLQYGDIEIIAQMDKQQITLYAIPNPEQLVYFIGQIENTQQ